MAQTGYSPISLYYSTTASAVPTNTNLVSGELAINITDGKLYYKDNGGTVRLLAQKGDVVTPITNNGVVYVNSSGQATSGSVLTFDGTNLGIGVTPSAFTAGRAMEVAYVGNALWGTGAGDFSMVANVKYNGALQYANSSIGANRFEAANGAYYWYSASGSGKTAGDPITFTQAMTLDASGNLGIGTTSPSTKVEAAGNIKVSYLASAANASLITNNTSATAGSTSQIIATNDASRALRIQYSSSGGIGSAALTGGFTGEVAQIFTDNNYPLSIGTNGTARLNIDTSGNLGLGVTPSAWGSNDKAIDLGGSNQSSISGYLATSYATGAYYNGTNWIYKQTGVTPTVYTQTYAGQHQWRISSSGTAGTNISFTQAMTLDASGNLALGTTSTPTGQASNNRVIQIYGAGTANRAQIHFCNSDTGETATDGSFIGVDTNKDFFIINREAAATVFENNGSERARIDSSGNLLVGTTSAIGTAPNVIVKQGTAGQQCFTSWNATTSGNPYFHEFGTEGTYTARGSITYNRVGGLTAYNTTSDYRAKDIFGPVVDSGTLIDSVPVYMGKMKGATQERPMFIAHETPPYAHTGEKDAVDADGNPVYQQMDASALIPVMWAEIQSLRKRVAQLEGK